MSRSSSYSGTSFVTCHCGEVAVVRKSTTAENPGRRFFGCVNYGHGDHCDFFDWVDKEKFVVSEHEKETYKLMNNLRVANEDLRSLNESIRETNAHLRIAVATEKRIRVETELKHEVCKTELKMFKKWSAILVFSLVLTVIFVWSK